MNHQFNVKIAKLYGVDEAIIIELVYWWIHKNECDEEETMFHEDKMWCRCTAEGFTKYIPYMSSQKIGRVLRSLEKVHNVIIVGNFNNKATNQTKWYTFTDEFKKVMKDAGYDFSKMKIGTFKNEKSYNSIINNPINDNNIKDNRKRLSNDNQKENLDFDSFYELYPRKRSRMTAEKAWKKLSVKDRKEAIEKLPVYIADCAECKREVKYPATYLNQRTWEDDFTNDGKLSKEEPTEESGIVYPDGMDEDQWTKITFWLCGCCHEIAGYISPTEFAEYKKRCGGDSKLLSRMLKEINSYVELHGRVDISDKLDEFLKKHLDNEQETGD